MSKQLYRSALFSVFATVAMAIAMMIAEPEGGNAQRGATAHGSLISVLVGA